MKPVFLLSAMASGLLIGGVLALTTASALPVAAATHLTDR